MAAPNLIPVTAPRSARQRKAGASAEHQRELKLKRAIDRAANAIDRLETRAKSYDALLRTLQRRKQISLQRAEKIENEILERMRAANLVKLTGNDRTLTLRANALSLVVVDPSKVPAEYIREKLIQEVDKVAAKVALQRGEDVAGVKLTQSVSLIRK